MAQRQALAGESVVQSVNHYRKIHAHVDIPLSFVVPNDSTWPADLHGFRLGNVLRRVKYKGALPEYHQELENIGFIMSASDHKFDLFLRSLKRYKELNDGAFWLTSQTPCKSSTNLLKICYYYLFAAHAKTQHFPLFDAP